MSPARVLGGGRSGRSGGVGSGGASPRMVRLYRCSVVCCWLFRTGRGCGGTTGAAGAASAGGSATALSSSSSGASAWRWGAGRLLGWEREERRLTAGCRGFRTSGGGGGGAADAARWRICGSGGWEGGRRSCVRACAWMGGGWGEMGGGGVSGEMGGRGGGGGGGVGTRMGMATELEVRSRSRSRARSRVRQSFPSVNALRSRRLICTTSAAPTTPQSPLLLPRTPTRRHLSSVNARSTFTDPTPFPSRRHKHTHAQAQEGQRKHHITHDVKVTYLTDRGLVAVVGEDAVRFLGGVCTGSVPDPFLEPEEEEEGEGRLDHEGSTGEETTTRTTAAAAATTTKTGETGEATYDPAINAASTGHSVPPRRAKNPRHRGFYTAFLNAQGRVLFDAFVYPASQSPGFWEGVPEGVRRKIDGKNAVAGSRVSTTAAARLPSSGGGEGGGESKSTQTQTPTPTENQKKTPAFLLDVHASQTHDLAKHLRRYKLRAKVDVWPVEEEEGGWSVFALWGDGYTSTSSSSSSSPSSSAAVKGEVDLDDLFTPTTIGTPHDPRHPSLGARIVLPPSYPLFPSATSPSSPPNNLSPNTPLKAYTNHRQSLSIPQGPHEIPPSTALPHEHNLDLLPGAIDFRKGCYIGQELVIRTQHTGVVRKRVLGVVLSRRLKGDGGAGGAEGTNEEGEQGRKPKPKPKPGDLVRTVERWIRIDGEEPDIVPFIPSGGGEEGGGGGSSLGRKQRPAGRWVASASSSSSSSSSSASASSDSSPFSLAPPRSRSRSRSTEATTTVNDDEHTSPYPEGMEDTNAELEEVEENEEEDTGLALIRLEKMTDLLIITSTSTISTTDHNGTGIEGVEGREGGGAPFKIEGNDEFVLRRRRPQRGLQHNENASTGAAMGGDPLAEQGKEGEKDVGNGRREVKAGERGRVQDVNSSSSSSSSSLSSSFEEKEEKEEKEKEEKEKEKEEKEKEKDESETENGIQEGDEILVRAVVPSWIREALMSKSKLKHTLKGRD